MAKQDLHRLCHERVGRRRGENHDRHLPARLNSTSHSSERLRRFRKEHETETADGRIEAFVVHIEILCGAR